MRKNTISGALLASALIFSLLLAVSGLALASGGGGGEGGGHATGLNWWKSDKNAPPIGWFIVDFLIMAGALYYLLRKPISNYLANRRAALAAQIEEARKLMAEIEAKEAEIEQKLGQIQKISADIAESFIKSGENEKAKLLDSAEKLAATIEASAKNTIDREVEAAKAKLKSEVAAKAIELAEAMISKNIRPEDNDRLVREFMARVSEIKPDKIH